VSNAIAEARSRVNAAVNNTLTQLFDRSRHHTVSDLIAAFRYSYRIIARSNVTHIK
jgi:hypothetical protein